MDTITDQKKEKAFLITEVVETKYIVSAKNENEAVDVCYSGENVFEIDSTVLDFECVEEETKDGKEAN